MSKRTLTPELVESIVTLRRVEREVDAPIASQLASVREHMEDLVGPTVRPADVARLLGISHPALLRWIKKSDVETVMTPTGRREVPLSELLSLLDEVDEVRDMGAKRPVARVVRERHRNAEAAVDLDRLVPPRGIADHRAAELQSLAYHRLVAERLDDPTIGAAKRRLERWRRTRQVDERWLDEWDRVLALPLSRIKKTIGANTVRARELRQTSPFAGVLTEHERRRLLHAVRERLKT